MHRHEFLLNNSALTNFALFAVLVLSASSANLVFFKISLCHRRRSLHSLTADSGQLYKVAAVCKLLQNPKNYCRDDMTTVTLFYTERPCCDSYNYLPIQLHSFVVLFRSHKKSSLISLSSFLGHCPRTESGTVKLATAGFGSMTHFMRFLTYLPTLKPKSLHS